MLTFNSGFLDLDSSYQGLLGNTWPGYSVKDYIIPGTYIDVEANGRISANLTNAFAVAVSDSRIVISTGNLTYDTGIALTDPKKILVSIEGILQIPTTDYTVSGNNLIFTGTTGPTSGSNIEIRLFGQEAIISLLTTASTTTGISEGTNLYFTNARAIAAVTPALTTSNVVETTNLYFTNARVAPALTHSDVSKLMISPFMLMGA
jgi:hypothetical protein